MPPTVTTKERARLKARAHSLEPIVQIGNAGVTATLIKEIDRALTAHELIKVKVSAPDREAREELCTDIAARTDAAAVQRVGNVLVLWRPKPEEKEPSL
jgi:RNA-binding protein